MKKVFSRSILVGLALVMMVVPFMLTGCGQNNAETEAPSSAAATAVDQDQEAASEFLPPDEVEGTMRKVQIDIQDYGTVMLELNETVAPISVANFIELAESGFYDGLTFHRIIDGFMIQGGCPEGTGTGGSDKNIKGEFIANGVANPISHVRGAVSMARSQHPDSASSQFFIVHENSTFLDGEYAGFGRVTEGMEFVDKIAKETPVTDNNGTVKDGAQPIITKVTVLD